MTGRGPAPVLYCSQCQRRISRRGGHHLFTADSVLLCSGCNLDAGLHRDLWPDCHLPGHRFPADHHPGSATRAGAAWVLGLWDARP